MKVLLKRSLSSFAILAALSGELHASTQAYWRFEEQTSGNVSATNTGGAVTNTVLDSSGQGNHMQTWTATTAPTYTTSVPFPAGTLAGVPATGALNTASLDFKGSPVDIYTGSKPLNSQTFTAWTVEASFCLDVTGRWQVIVGKDGNPVGGQPPLSLKVRADNKMEIGIVDGSGAGRWCVGSTKIEANKWYQVAATATATELSLWIKPEGCRDYIAQGSVPIQGAFFNTYSAFNQPWIVGRGMWNGAQKDATDGRIDEVRISDTALPLDQFLGNYAVADSDADDLPDTWELIHLRANATETDAEILAKQSSLTADPDGDGYANRVELRAGTSPAIIDNLTGKLTRQVWLKIPGDKIADLTHNARFYGKADITTLNDGISTPRDIAENYGQRLQGWITAPVTGDYTFWVAGDNQCELWLSTGQSKFNKQFIASVPVWTAPDEWDKFPAQKSATISLVAGQKYFIECLHKEATLADSLSVAWQAPGEARQVIPAQQFEPYLDDVQDQDLDGLVDEWEQSVGLSTDFFFGAEGDDGAAADPDGDGFSNLLEAQSSGDPFSVGGNAGYVSREIWTGLPGDKLKDLTATAAFPKPANDASFVSSALSFGDLKIDSYGQRIQGLIVPPKSGNWRFWLSSDDQGEFQLSTSASAVDKRRTAYLGNWVAAGNYDASATQKSEAKDLVAGVPYYFEILHKENVGWDHASLAWAYQPVNWALASNGSTATQSSTYDPVYHAGMAIDGVEAATTFTHTNSVANSWWQVDFGQDRAVNRIVLTNRYNLRERLSNFRIAVLDSAGNELAGQDCFVGIGNAGAVFTWNLPATVEGRKIKIQLLGNNNAGNGILTLAEVQAYEWSPEADRQVVGSQHLRTATPDPLDADGDSLPDTWEMAEGLDPADNGAANLANGEYGDSDGDLMPNREEYLLGLNPRVADHAPGRVLVERWNNINGYRIREFLDSKRLYGAADQVELKSPADLKFPGLYFGTRTRGYFVPKQTGDYTFWVSSDAAELWFGADPATGKYGKRRIAILDPSVGTSAGVAAGDSNLWDHFASQRSVPIHLEAGRSYYFEVLNQHGHPANTHVSLAWARAGGVRESLSGEMVTGYLKTADDQDDDYLPDAWEQQFGLDPTDNGLVDAVRQGERGDYDHDGLSNREEYLWGTNPNNPDSDGDGVNDSQEVTLATNPLTPDAPTMSLAGTVDLGQYLSPGTTWISVDGGLVSEFFRGSVEWPFQVTEPGIYVIQLDSRLRGGWTAGDSVPVEFSVDGRFIARKRLTFDSAGKAIFRLHTQQLQAGEHRLRLLIDNVVARRSVQIDAIRIFKPTGVDADGNGLADWLDQSLGGQNYLTPTPTLSRTSPAFIEGSARFVSDVVVEAGSAPVATESGLHASHWYANLPLAPAAPISYRIEFGEGEPATGSLGWEPTNVLSGETLRIRKGDSLLLSASNGDPAGSATLMISGQSHLIQGDQTYVHQFNDAGNFEVTANHSSGTTATLKVEVKQADFGPVRDVVCNESKLLRYSAPGTSSGLNFEGGDGLILVPGGENATGTDLWFYPQEGGALALAARLWAGGPIISKGAVNSILLSDTLQNDFTRSELSTSFPGYAVYYSYLVSTGLPPGGKIIVTIYRGGVTFLDGTTVKEFTVEDFINGTVTVEMLVPGTLDGGACHYITIVDRNGVVIGRR